MMRLSLKRCCSRWAAVGAGLSIATVSAQANAAQTTNYSYDARGRLVAVSHVGGPADGVQTTYAYDRADNRTEVTTIGAPNAASGATVVVPLNGLTVLVIP